MSKDKMIKDSQSKLNVKANYRVTDDQLLQKDILGYLKSHEDKDMLRFLTCGSVDDGKSTLIGRLLHDSKMIFEDQLAAIEKDSKKSGTQGDEIDLALLVDGLQSEREQGITIDVAYRYFATEKRKFIIADTPGHEQYTRNMATGASHCNMAIILIDARAGVKAQTRRHSYIVSLLGIKKVIVAVNKMDLVDYKQTAFEAIKKEYLAFSQQLGFDTIQIIPMSALKGDNVVNPSEPLSWFHGSSLITALEEIEIHSVSQPQHFRLPVQWVNRPSSDFRGYSGTVAAGSVKVGDKLVVLPSGKNSRVKSLVTFDGEQTKAIQGEAITVILEDEIDISRGDMLCHVDSPAQLGRHFEADIVWMSEDALMPNKQYDFKMPGKYASGSIDEVLHRVEINSMQQIDATHLELNEIGPCRVKLTQQVAFDDYESSPMTGSFVMIDRMSNITVAAGMIRQAYNPDDSDCKPTDYSEFEFELNTLVRKHFPHWGVIDLGRKN
ncbi:MAG: sulfate adenylyltransferase subunit CysN [Enterobacterales bacterium]|nr:sulfate adenylyltransferase subunit CysN [Enterobacterales bacterium]